MKTETIRAYVDNTGKLVSSTGIRIRKATTEERAESAKTAEGWIEARVSTVAIKRRRAA